jgi:hypothetical protein
MHLKHLNSWQGRECCGGLVETVEVLLRVVVEQVVYLLQLHLVV